MKRRSNRPFVQPTPLEIAQIKQMRHSYKRDDFRTKGVVERNGWSISPTATTTAFAADLIDIAKEAGCIGMLSKFFVAKADLQNGLRPNSINHERCRWKESVVAFKR